MEHIFNDILNVFNNVLNTNPIISIFRIECLLVGIFSFFLYFLPTIIANQRKARSRFLIFALNLLLGWTLIGWIVALVWAMESYSKYEEIDAVNPVPKPVPPDHITLLERLARLREIGALDEDEFVEEKRKVIKAA
jgi:hypothetical protein